MNYSFEKVVNRRNPLESPLKYNGKYEMNFAKFKKFHTKTTQKIRQQRSLSYFYFKWNFFRISY